MRTVEQNVRAAAGKEFRVKIKIKISIVKHQQHLPGKKDTTFKGSDLFDLNYDNLFQRELLTNLLLKTYHQNMAYKVLERFQQLEELL